MNELPPWVRHVLIPLLLAGLAIIALGVLSMGCSSPAAPSPLAIPDPPELRFIDASDWQREAGWALWNEQKLCVGYSGKSSREFPVYVHPDGVWCDSHTDRRAGCTWPDHIDVGAPWYEPALSHEYIHYELRMLGQNSGHSNPAFCGPRHCDWRNCPPPGVDVEAHYKALGLN